MYDWSRELGFPLMAGSSIPVDVRTPALEIPYSAPIRQAVGVGMGGVEPYGFHALEGLQCMVERRAGGETGVAAVEMLTGEAVWRWRDGDGAWSAPLLEAALRGDPQTAAGRPEDNARRPVLFRLEYRDGLQAAVYMLDGHARSFLFAGRVEGQPDVLATKYDLARRESPQVPPRQRRYHNFDALVRCIEEFFATGRPLYPVERTLLTTGALAFLFEAKGAGRRETPELAISYRAPERCWFQRA
jgi:hypothetical protein